MISTVLNIALWVFSIAGYVIYNLYNKNVKLEEMIQRQDQVLREASSTINESDRVLKELDKLGAFQSDDEVGFFFQAVKEIQATLNQYVTNK
jgi:hypothetical protein